MKKMQLPPSIADMASVNEMDIVFAGSFVFSPGYFKEIENLFKQYTIGLFREKYFCFERRSLFVPSDGFIVEGFISIGVGSPELSQEIEAQTAIHNFCCAQWRKGKQFYAYFARKDDDRCIILVNVSKANELRCS